MAGKRAPEEERARLESMILLEEQRRAEGYAAVAGVDEAGRGPLAGPVYAAAVVLYPGQMIEGVDDSKKLSKKKREELYERITRECADYATASVSAEEIDEINILNAAHLAMNKAVGGLKNPPDYVLVDGNSIRGMTVPHETVVKGDAKCLCIAAASILAKVERDRYMEKAAQKYPGYGFEKHAGYGTKAHYEAIRELGECPIHRRTFLKKFYEREKNERE